jgi:hypothetical protein
MYSKLVSRIITSAICLVTFGAAFQAPPAALAATTLYVDDNGFECPSATHTSIGAAIAAAPPAGATIIVCSGDYDPFTISGRTKITVKGQDMDDRPVIRLPASVAEGVLISVSDSTNIVLDSLIVDGDNFTDGYEPGALMRGIDWNSSSGTIQNSRIINYRDRPISGALGIAIWIRDTSPAGAATKVIVKNNAILEFQLYGIWVMGPIKATITGNHIDGANGETDGGGQDGILIAGDIYGLPSGSISSNLIANTGYGIALNDTARMSITRNTMHANSVSVRIYSGCSVTTMATLGSSSNKISGNMMLETDHGVEIVAQATNNGSSTLCNPKASKNTVSGNTITAESTPSSEAVLIQTSTTGSVTSFVPEAFGNKVTGNTMWGYLDAVKAIGNVDGTVNSGNRVK